MIGERNSSHILDLNLESVQHSVQEENEPPPRPDLLTPYPATLPPLPPPPPLCWTYLVWWVCLGGPACAGRLSTSCWLEELPQNALQLFCNSIFLWHKNSTRFGQKSSFKIVNY